MEFTSAGKEMLEDFKSKASSSSTDSNTGESTETTMDICIGDETMLSIKSEHVDENRVKYTVAEEADKRYVETLAVLLNSALNDGSFDVNFTVSEIRSFAPNTLYVVFGIMLAVIVALIIVAIVKMGRFGVVNMYATLSYFIITTLCFAFISRGVFVVSLGSVLVYLMGLALVNACSYKVYKAIKAEAALGKTIESSVKAGYKKNLMFTVDLYAVLALGAIALLIGVGGLATVAAQALIAVVTGAFISLLWGRVINYMLLSASKDKYKYFKLVREDDDDE
jgi:preprotein translocase subunit SecD